MSHEFDVAVVGTAGRFPGADDVNEFRQNLLEGRESVTFFSPEELLAAGVDRRLIDDPRYVPAAPILSDPATFDAAFFGYSPREAQVMDPQHRLFLESCWHALEHAGYDSLRIDGRVSVFGGSAMNTYLLSSGLVPEFFDDYLPTLIGSDKDYLATRVAFKLDLTGPAITVQTACSSSLVAVHMATQSLVNEECDLALAGGVAVRVPHIAGHLYEAGNILSPDGHCRTFDAEAAGTVFGSGCGVVALKRFDDAVADNDTIQAVIRGSAVNNDGASKIGFTAPSLSAQSEVVAEALGSADVTADTITYVEAHGTGTKLGDPIEIAALTKAFRTDTDAIGYCGIGSVKTNIGHLDAAAGVASLIKVVGALSDGVIPASLHYGEPNPAIEFEKTPFEVVTEPTPWRPHDGLPRRAGISSLGIGGTNAHLIVEEHPRQQPAPRSERPPGRELIRLSARTPAALDRACAALATQLGRDDDAVGLADVAYTLAAGRRTFAHRAVVVADTPVTAGAYLSGSVQGRLLKADSGSVDRPVAFLFSGQGAQYPGMGHGLYRQGSVYREALDLCAEQLIDLIGVDLRPLLCQPGHPDDGRADDLAQTELTQPALFAFEYALARQWDQFGVRAEAMVGHSIGEYVAATMAGVFDLPDALRIVAARGQLMARAEPGSMLAVSLPESQVGELVSDDISLAAINGPEQCVLAGSRDAIAAVAEQLEQRQVHAQLLRTSHAFHSHLMDGAACEFRAVVEDVELSGPTVPFTSCVTGDWITAEQACDPGYWADHIRSTVRFSDCLSAVAGTDSVLVEIGPGRTLSTLARQHPSTRRAPTMASSRQAASDDDDEQVLLEAVGGVWAAGGAIAGPSLQGSGPYRRVPLPGYPFERTRHWFDRSSQALASAQPLTRRADTADWFSVRSWARMPPMIDRELTVPTAVIGGPGTLRRSLEHHLGANVTRLEDARHLVFLRALDVESGDVLEQRVDAVTAGPYRELHALGRQLGSRREDVVLTVVVDRAAVVVGTEPARAEQAMLVGLARTIDRELEGVAVRVLDIDQRDEGSDLLTAVLAPGGRSLSALRAGTRWVPSVVPVRLDGNAKPAITVGGVYLITGGLGGVGRAVADRLADRYGAKLVLIGRSATPDGESSIGEHGDVLTLAADVTDATSIETAVRAAVAHFGRLDGVIHAAGLIDERLIRELDVADSEAVMAPKTVGTLNLAAAVAPYQPDFIAVFSSINGQLAPAALSAYTSANLFLDAYAESPEGIEANVVSVAWPAWSIDAGMAANTTSSAARAEALARGVDADAGLEALQRALGSGLRAVSVSPVDLTLQIGELDDGSLRQVVTSQSVVADESGAEPAPLDATSTERVVADLWCSLLGLRSVGLDEDFFDLGGSSALAVRLFGRIERTCGVLLPIDLLAEAPTVAMLASEIEAHPDYAAPAGNPRSQRRPAHSLVRLRSGGGGPGLYLVHAEGGHLMAYQQLTKRWSDERPLFGLRSIAVDGSRPPDATVADMAARYVAEITEQQPSGPYHLAGWCLGGTIAIEMARLLRSQGDEVGLVCAIQSPNPNFPGTDTGALSIRRLASRVAYRTTLERHRLGPLDSKAKARFVLDKSRELRARWVDERLRRPTGPDHPHGISQQVILSAIRRANLAAFDTHTFESYEGDITVVRCEIQAPGVAPDPAQGWGDLVGGEIRTFEVPGYHVTMLFEPNVGDVADVLLSEIAHYEQLTSRD